MPNTNTILDVILEKADNVEVDTKALRCKKFLADALKTLACREKAVRECTVTFSLERGLNAEEIIEFIQTEWVIGNAKPRPTYWQDKKPSACSLPASARSASFWTSRNLI